MSRHTASSVSTDEPSQEGRILISYGNELRAIRRIAGAFARFGIPGGATSPSRGVQNGSHLNHSVGLVPSLVIDTSAFVAIERGEREPREQLARALAEGARIVAPASVLTERNVAPLAAAIATIVPIDPALTRCATGLLGRASHADMTDALTVATALREWSATILTGNGRSVSLLVLAAQHAELNVVSL